MGTTTLRAAVAANVRAEIARRRLRQGNLAEQLGMSQQALSRRLTADVAFDVDELERLSTYLEISLEQLLASTAPVEVSA